MKSSDKAHLREYLNATVNPVIRPLVTEALKKKPTSSDIYDFLINKLKEMKEANYSGKKQSIGHAKPSSGSKNPVGSGRRQNDQIKGILKLNIIRAKNLDPKDVDPYCRINVGGQTFNTLIIRKNNCPVWKSMNEVPIKFGKEEILSKSVTIVVWDRNFITADAQIGSLDFELYDLISQPNKWDQQKKKLIPFDENKKDVGEIYFQTKFIPEGEMDDGSIPPLLEEHHEPKLAVRGVLKLNIVSAKYLNPNDVDPYCKINLGKQTISTLTVRKNNCPVWKSMNEVKLEITKDEAESTLVSIEVFDRNFLTADILIGSVNCKLHDLVEKSNTWDQKIERLIPVDKSKTDVGEIYYQTKFILEGDIDDGSLPPLLEHTPERNPKVSGFLKLNIVCAKDLKPKEIDPYCRIKVGSQTINTLTVRRNNCPIWKSMIEVKFEITQDEVESTLVSIEVWDRDFVADERVGSVNLNLYDLLERANQWDQRVTKLIPAGKSKTEVGEIYYQAKFILEGEMDDNYLPPPLIDLEALGKRK